jgi:hypothetical protein
MATATTQDNNAYEKTESTSERVFRKVKELFERGEPASRPVLAETLQLPMSSIDDSIKYLRSQGRIAIVVNGVYKPEDHMTVERAVSATIMPSGMFKLEIGDQVLELTMREARNVSAVTAGVALQFRG